MPFNIDMQVHYCVNSVEESSVLKLVSHNCHCVYNINLFLNIGWEKQKREDGNKKEWNKYSLHPKACLEPPLSNPIKLSREVHI